MEHLDGIEDEIDTAADKLIAAIQRDREELLSQVETRSGTTYDGIRKFQEIQ